MTPEESALPPEEPKEEPPTPPPPRRDDFPVTRKKRDKSKTSKVGFFDFNDEDVPMEEEGGSLVDTRVRPWEKYAKVNPSRADVVRWMLEKIIDNGLTYDSLTMNYAHVDGTVREEAWQRSQQRASKGRKA